MFDSRGVCVCSLVMSWFISKWIKCHNVIITFLMSVLMLKGGQPDIV